MNLLNTPLDPRMMSTLLGSILRNQMQQNDPLKQLKIQEAQAKLGGGQDTATQIARILGGGQQQASPEEEMPISFGRDPRTGTWSFNNLGFVNSPEGGNAYDVNLPEFATTGRAGVAARAYSSPEVATEVQGVKQRKQQRAQQAAVAPQAAPSSEGMSPEVIARSAELASFLKKQGYPADTINMVLQNTFPQLGEQKRKATAADKEMNYIRTHAKDFYNKETGQPAGSSDVLSETFDPAEFRKTHMELNTEQKKNAEALSSVDQQIDAYRFLKENLDRTSQPGYINTVKNWMTSQGQYLRGDPKYAALQAARTQITQLARAFGGDSRVSDKEMALLQGAVISDSDNKEAIEAKLKALESFRASKAKQVGLPWLQKQQGDASPAPSGAQSGAQTGSGKLASQQDISRAMQQAKGDRRKALELLKSQGFTGAQ